MKHTVNNRCVTCARVDAADFHRTAIAGKPWPEGKPITDEMNIGWDASPIADFVGHAGNPDNAVKMGAPVWIRPDPCSRAGHIGVRLTDGGGCYFCKQERDRPSPRQLALAAGETWYTPDQSCKYCGTLAPRRVDNGRCKGCSTNDTASSDGRQTETSQMMRDNPDMVISRSDARVLGMSVYRTGQPCKRGHTGWRYVSTSGCIECLRAD